MPIDLLEVARLRLRNQRVTGAKLPNAPCVVAWLGCVQAQDYSLAKWSLGMRVDPTIRETDVDAALANGQILRTHILRPTWHYVAPADIRWIMRLTGPRVVSGIAHRQRSLEIDDATLASAHDAIVAALQGGTHLARPEIAAVLNAAGIATDGQRIVHILAAAEMSLLIASGRPRGNMPTYALLDEWAPPTAQDKQPLDRDWALAQLTRRFFTSHGPATVGDFTWWSGVNGRDSKRGIDINGSELESLDVDGQTYWWAGDVGGSAAPPESPNVQLMQAYDEYVVAYKSPRTPINIGGLGSPNVLQQTPFYHAIFVDSQLAGFWRRLSAGAGYRVELSLLRSLTPPERDALELEVERYSAFAGKQVALVN